MFWLNRDKRPLRIWPIFISDNSNRWVEIQALNPGVTGLKPGQMVKIPNHAEMFSQLAR
jgi:hypothetical protein